MCENCGKCGCGEKPEKEVVKSKVISEKEKVASEKNQSRTKAYSFVEI